MDDLERDVVLQMEKLANAQIVVKLPALPAFAAISAIQLATRHGFPRTLAPVGKPDRPAAYRGHCARPNSPLHKLYMMGWDSAHDDIKPRE